MANRPRALVEYRDPTTVKLIEQHLAEANRIRREGGNTDLVDRLEQKALAIAGGQLQSWRLRNGQWHRNLGSRRWWLVGSGPTPGNAVEEVVKEERQALEQTSPEPHLAGSFMPEALLFEEEQSGETAVTATLKAMQSIVEDDEKPTELRISAGKVIAALLRSRGRSPRPSRY